MTSARQHESSRMTLNGILHSKTLGVLFHTHHNRLSLLLNSCLKQGVHNHVGKHVDKPFPVGGSNALFCDAVILKANEPFLHLNITQQTTNRFLLGFAQLQEMLMQPNLKKY